MTSRAGRHLAYFGFAALIGGGLQSVPAAAQSYLADNSQGQVTVDYSVLGGGYSGVSRSALPGGALPSGTCSCGNAPMGVLAAAPRPTFNNPFGANLAMQAPAVPPGFMTYAQATGAPAYSGSSGGAVVLRAPSGGNAPKMAAMPTAPAQTQPADEGNAPAATAEQPTGTQTAELPKNTPTQSGGTVSGGATSGGTASGTAASGGASAPTTGTENAPSQPEQMPTSVPSPVGPGDTVANVAQAPAAQPSGTESNTQATAPTTNTQSNEAENPAANTQSTGTATATPPAQPSTEQQAAVTPTPPASGGNATPSGGGSLPAGAYRILYTGDTDDVPGNASGDLDKVAQAMQADTNMRIQILAYAAGTEDTESKARRKSLARGLAVRSYLLKAGIASTRMDVRALGSKADGGPADRVDIVPAS